MATLSDKQRKAMFAKQAMKLSDKKGRFVAVVFTETTTGQDRVRAGMEQSPRHLIQSIGSSRGKKILGSVSADNRSDFLKKLKKISGVHPESAESIEKTFGTVT